MLILQYKKAPVRADFISATDSGSARLDPYVRESNVFSSKNGAELTPTVDDNQVFGTQGDTLLTPVVQSQSTLGGGSADADAWWIGTTGLETTSCEGSPTITLIQDAPSYYTSNQTQTASQRLGVGNPCTP